MAPVERRPIRRLLIANRGEIARRILRTAHDMGIGTVAVFAEPDSDSPFVAEADEAIALGGRTSAESYLQIEKILDAARRTGADAIHPGYGFLAENSRFAEAVIEAGIAWVGPGPEAISAMGDKLSAKRLMEEAKVPTLHAVELTAEQHATKAAKKIGYPVLVKAAAGGGGKGMRVVESEAELEEAIAAARREAAGAFGDDTLFLERWLAGARHVEIQILGDLHGSVVSCFERECSIQRRHQKILEEAPSPAVDEALRARMGQAAVAAGEAIRYVSAGTVEFLLQGEEFFFLEVNTRLQVEHPVTEEITGLDLVREQLRIAQGEPLGYEQQDLRIDGHAIEARLYAEDPERDFLPSTGTLVAWRPSNAARARFDSGVEVGSRVGIEFDPLLAKVIVHAPTRQEAAARLARVLETTRIQGLVTNRDFLVSVLRTPEFIAGDTTTDFIERVAPELRRQPTSEELAEAALVTAMAGQARRRRRAKVLRTMPSGWRNTRMPPEEVRFESERGEIEVTYRIQRDGRFVAHAGEGDHIVDVVSSRTLEADEEIELLIDDRRLRAIVTFDGDHRFLHGPNGDFELRELSPFPVLGLQEVAGGLVAPMPGKVISTHVEAGDVVEAGQLLLVLEAMKMEHRVTAVEAGRVTDLRVSVGDQVANGELLVVLEAEEAN